MSALMDNIFLIGFMGSGKSQVGRLLARRLQRTFVDTDTQVELAQRLTVDEVFRRFGEARFRELELQELAKVVRNDGQVVALGGGTPAREQAWELLAGRGVTVYLKRSVKQLARHLHNAVDRPLLQGVPQERLPEKIAGLLREREKWYTRAHLILECRDGWTREQTLQALLRLLELD